MCCNHLKPKLHYMDLLWICCTTNPQQIRLVEFGFKHWHCYFSLSVELVPHHWR